jgi:hypothetical protein
MAGRFSSTDTREGLRGCGGGAGGAPRSGGKTKRMKLRVWPRRRSVEQASERASEGPAIEEPNQPPAPPGAPGAEQAAAPAAPPAQPASSSAHRSAPDGEGAPSPSGELPAEVSLTLEEAKTAIRAAGGDVIQVGFLARAYLRHREEEPESAETAAAREPLCELVAKRLKDRKLLAPGGRFELLE